MKYVVYDTNVIISGWLWSGAPRQAIDLARNHTVQIVISEEMLEELRDVLQRDKFALRLERLEQTADELINDLLHFCQIVEITPIPPTVAQDPDDDIVLASALASNAEIIVTGDSHLLHIESFQHIQIMDVNTFLQTLASL